ncbi:MAG: hypothetical protein OEU86_02555, partial [Gammaproteobacteria bacterium]|nr:hypothetical protein [Gammaproteobacteria bacterium]
MPPFGCQPFDAPVERLAFFLTQFTAGLLFGRGQCWQARKHEYQKRSSLQWSAPVGSYQSARIEGLW